MIQFIQTVSTMHTFEVLLLLCVAGSCKCGVPKNVGILSGHKIIIEQAPFMAQVYRNNEFKCGGSIVHERFILTAAHCVKPYIKSKCTFVIKVGTDLNSNVRGGELYKVEDYIVHPYFSFFTAEFDACLIKVSRTIELGDKVRIVELADSTVELPAGTMLNVTGWGMTEIGETNNLMQVSVPFVDRKQCLLDYSDDPINGDITSNMICAGVAGKEQCFGDSGGNIQVGVISFVHSDGCAKAPGVSTRISSVVGWIRNTIREFL